MMKKTLISSAVLALIGSAAALAADQPLKAVGVSMGNMGNPFFVTLAKGAEEKAKELGGDKVKVTIMLRGREISRPIGGVELLQRLADDVEEYGTVESKPKQEGRNIIMTLVPKGKKVHTQSEQRRRGAESRAERQARQAARLAAKQESQAQAAADAQSAISQKTSDKKQPSKEGSNAEDEN